MKTIEPKQSGTRVNQLSNLLDQKTIDKLEKLKQMLPKENKKDNTTDKS